MSSVNICSCVSEAIFLPMLLSSIFPSASAAPPGRTLHAFATFFTRTQTKQRTPSPVGENHDVQIAIQKRAWLRSRRLAYYLRMVYAVRMDAPRLLSQQRPQLCARSAQPAFAIDQHRVRNSPTFPTHRSFCSCCADHPSCGCLCARSSMVRSAQLQSVLAIH